MNIAVEFRFLQIFVEPFFHENVSIFVVAAYTSLTRVQVEK